MYCLGTLTALKVKLMVRRPITTLVAQGILPSPKTSPALYEQRQKLERAKMGDMLRAKIARRPDRSELVHRHILEDVRPGVDPSLCDKQRQLKRAKLADTLSNQLQARPGPLELVAKNILHVVDDDDNDDEEALETIRDKNKTLSVSSVESEQVSRFIDSERIPLPEFTPTNQGLPTYQVAVPHKYTVDEDSSSDVSGILSPPDVFSSFSDSPRGNFQDITAPSTPNSFCLSQQMSPNMGSETPIPKSLRQVQSSSSVTKSESHDAIFSSHKKDSTNAKTFKASTVQASTGLVQKEDNKSIKQHKRRASAADASIFVAPSPSTIVGTATSGGVLSGRSSSSSQSPSPSPATSNNTAGTRPISLQLASTAHSVPYSQRGAPGKDQTNRRKTAKAKKSGHSISSSSSSLGIGGKQKVIKFHEYKVVYQFIIHPIVAI